MSKELSPTQARQRLGELIKDIRFAMFTTRHDGQLHSRPMTTQLPEDDDSARLWFFASRKGAPVADIGRDSNVNVSYADPDKDAYVSVSGHAKVVEDMARKNALWSTIAEAWFPGGVTDPDLALIEVTISGAELWDVNANKAMQLFKMAKAAVTGDRPDEMGEHATVRAR